MLPKKFIIRNAEIWNADSVRKNQDLLVREGKIEKIAPAGRIQDPVETEFDAQNQALIPLGVDLQIHLRTPGQPNKEKPETGLKAALVGGYGLVLTMPNTQPTVDSPEVVKMGMEQSREAEEQTGVELLWSGSLTESLEGRRLSDYKALKESGVVALTDDGVGVQDDELMLKAFEAAAQADLPVLQHCEFLGHGAALAAGRVQKKLDLKAYPAEAEWKMIERDLKLLRSQKSPARYHVLHISSKKSLELVVAAKKEGLPVTGEVTPHHLFFNSDDIPEGNSNFKMNPPLRSEEDRLALIEGLAEGAIDFVSTDHAPHEKAIKGPDFKAAAFGSTGLESSFRVLLALQAQGKLSRERLVAVWSTRAAQFIKKDKDYGYIKEGVPLRALWADTRAEARRFEEADLASASQNNVFLGQKLPGRIQGVFNPKGLFRF